MSKKQVLIFGAGSYVLGDSYGNGVVYISLLHLLREKQIDGITFLVRSERNGDFYNKLKNCSILLDFNYAPNVIVYDNLKSIDLSVFQNAVGFVCVPDYIHFEISQFLLNLNVPIWIVKPLTGNFEESLSLAKMARQLKVPTWVDYHKRFDPSNLKIRKILEDGNLGKLLFYSVQYSQSKSYVKNELNKWSDMVDVCQYIGCHYIDQMFFLFPKLDVYRVSSTGIKSTERTDGPEYKIIHCIVDFKNTIGEIIRFDLNVSWGDPNVVPAKSHQRVDLQFEDGRIIADQKFRGMEIWTDLEYKQINNNFFEIFYDSISQRNIPFGYGFESINNFFAFLGNNNISAQVPDALSSAKTDLVLNLVHRSLFENGNWIYNETNLKDL